MKALLTTSVIIGLAISVFTLAAPSPPQKPADAIMGAKLRAAQTILEGLATEDYPGIRANAMRLSQLSRAAQWRVDKGPEYTKLSDDFRRAVDAMADHAREKNLDACTLDYVQMTMICVKCHKYVRKVGIAEITPQSVEDFTARLD